jgi:hypothetical protein
MITGPKVMGLLFSFERFCKGSIIQKLNAAISKKIPKLIGGLKITITKPKTGKPSASSRLRP